MKLKELIEQVVSGSVAPVVIPGGFGGIIRRKMPENGLICFTKKKKKKKLKEIKFPDTFKDYQSFEHLH